MFLIHSKNSICRLTIVFATAAALLLIGIAMPASASGIKKILIMPFSFNSGEDNDLSFLKKGINTMLQTRLRHIDKTEVIFPESGKSLPSDPLKAGQLYQADYVLSGSITMFGEKVSTDASLFSTQDQKEVLAFGEFGKTKGDAIEHINDLAAKINLDVFGIDTLPSRSVQQQLAMQSRYGYQQMPKFGSNNAFAFQSKPVPGQIRSIAVGDINGDHDDEIVYATKSSLKAVSLKGKQETVIAEKDISGFSNILRIDLFDFNKNGKDEIIITSSDPKRMVNTSFALEIDKNNTFKEIPLEKNYFYRLMENEYNETMLAAQRREYKGTYDDKIFKADYQNDDFVISDQKISLPVDSNIYSFTAGHILSSKGIDYAVYRGSDGIQILDDSRSERYFIGGDYGKSPIYFNKPTQMSRKQDELDPEYIDQRILISDLDGDGKNELVVVKNKESGTQLLARLRLFSQGQIVVFSWDDGQNTFRKVWESRLHSGVITDVNIGDANNDGKKELVYAVTPKSKSILQALDKQKSYIVVKGF